MSATEAKSEGAKAFEAGEWEDSIGHMTTALTEGDVYSIFQTRARANLKLNRLEAALKDAQAMTAIEPTSSQGYLMQADILRTLNRYGAEAQAYQDGVDAVPKDDERYASLERGLQDAKKISKSILNDPRMMELFVLFDHDNSTTVDFKDIAIGLYQLTDDMQDAQRQAAALLLMMDKDDSRTLVYEQFAKLIMAMSAISGISLDVMYEQLTEALKNEKPIPKNVLDEIQVTQDELSGALKNIQKNADEKKTIDALSYNRTSKLFDQWDSDGDGTIDFQELMAGLRKHQRAVSSSAFANNNNSIAQSAKMSGDVETDALLIMGYDDDSNQKLDKEEFALAISRYAEHIGVDLNELIDFMCTVASQSESKVVTDYENAYSDATALKNWANRKQTSSRRLGLGTIVDICEEDEEEEEED